MAKRTDLSTELAFLPTPFEYLKYRAAVSKTKHVMCPGDIL